MLRHDASVIYEMMLQNPSPQKLKKIVANGGTNIKIASVTDFQINSNNINRADP